MNQQGKNSLRVILQGKSLGDHDSDYTMERNDIEKREMNLNLVFVKFELMVKHYIGDTYLVCLEIESEIRNQC